MYKIWISTLLCFLAYSMQAQFGVRLGVSTSNQHLWENRMRPIGILEGADFQNYSISVDYRNCFRKSRLEFYPGLSYVRSNQVKLTSSANGFDYNLKYQSLSIGIITHAYILDWFGSCNGSTQDKWGRWFQKGLFLHIGADGGLRHIEAKGVDNRLRDTASEFVIRANGGIGLDIGISEIITLAPIVKIGYDHSIEIMHNGGTSRSTWAYGGEIRLGIELSR